MDEAFKKKMEEEAKKKISEKVRKELEEHDRREASAFVAPFPQRPVMPAPGEPVFPAFGYAPYSPYQLPRAERPYIMTVELLDDGMVLRYSYPVKRTVTIPGRPGFGVNEPAIQLFFEGIAEAIDGGGEEWNEESRKGKFAKMFEKMRAISAPKKVERYVFETRSYVCKNATELEVATKAAREAAKLVKELQDSGEVIQTGHPGSVIAQAPGHYLTDCFGSGEGDYTLGA